ncbi:hypothetical protein M409DRAFT_22147 [Zasmidium cellare ATCC 36951]|uniref:Uncharacterized protein n=1 Tax=Zasmidium cellare ATCC 36951 TaxID=1080233 RepID=A0A6A6CJC9_ZASCE|nr:uncharacterized protein M409DRAFT_22147 [Zasmidium cellare ATCC 36951]KAF2167337.1 hypothetical protein M409DRAFT_22147 [Zasmidium cellare ATCC 36951]
MMFFNLAGTKRKVEADTASAQQQKRQRLQTEEMTRRTYLQQNDHLNSSLQSPLLSHLHNQRMQSVHQLQSLPDSIFARIFIFTDLIQDEPIDLPMSRAFIRKNNIALLSVNHRLHKLALGMFWSVNSFVIRIEKFNAAAILPWWTHVSAVRKEVEENSIVMADHKTNNFLDADFYPLEDVLYEQDLERQEVEKKSMLMADPRMKDLDDTRFSSMKDELSYEALAFYHFHLRRTKPWSTTVLPLGAITLDVPYDPHWSNLNTWLRLFHEGKVPALTSSDIGHGASEWKNLHQIVGLFLSVQRDKGGKWEDVEKSLEGWQYTLKFADSRWQFENGPAQEVLVLQDDDDEEQLEKEKNPQEMGGDEEEERDLLDQLSKDVEMAIAPADTPGCKSTQSFGSSPPPSSRPYHTPGPQSHKRVVYLPDSDDEEEDLADGEKGDDRMSSPEL